MEQKQGSKVVSLEIGMEGVVEKGVDFEHVVDIEQMESEGIFLCWLVEVSTWEAIP